VAPFAIYCRASEEDGDGFSSSPEEQEAEARAWAERGGMEVEDEPVFEVVSGAAAAQDRRLGQLIERCEAGELAGIIVRDLNRFARDVVAGGAALARIVESGARLVATRNSFDSENLTPETEMMFNMLMAVGQAERKRNRLRRQFGKDKAAMSGVWCSAVPVGYDRDAEGRLQPNGDGEAVRMAFKLRAEGLGFSEIARRLPAVTVTHTRDRTRVQTQLTRSGVRRLIANRAYLGEQRVPNGSKGNPKVIEGSHRPLVTEAEWEAANAIEGQGPRHTGLAAEVAGLRGLVRCGNCGGTLHVIDKQRPRYTCTAGPGRCTGRGSMIVQQLEDAVDRALTKEFKRGRAELVAVAQQGERYSDALDAVEDANRSLAEYRDNVELQRVLGMKDWTEGLRVRKEAIEVARRALRELGPKPRPVKDVRRLLKDSSRTFVAEVRVYPRVAEHRLAVRWAGAAKPEAVAVA
jgi:DNA invertase Pin-like site-specific DNA recombinase